MKVKTSRSIRRKSFIAYSLLFGVFILSEGCSKEEVAVDCPALLKDIDNEKSDYLASPDPTKCQDVLKTYDS